MLHDCVFAGPVNTVRADLGTAAEELVTDRAGLLLISCVPGGNPSHNGA